MTHNTLNARRAAAALGTLLFLAACGGRGTGSGSSALPAAFGAPSADADRSLMRALAKQVVIGSTVDPANGAQNPYGLTFAAGSSGKLKDGDLVVCNFNAKSNVQGTGRSIVALHPVPGSKPVHVSDDPTLQGCDALAIGSDRAIWAAAMVANDNPVIGSTGKLVTNIKGKPFDQPWGQAFAMPPGGKPAFYASNAGDGTIVRINLGAKFTYDVIAKGFPVNHGKPGTALAPSGLSYDAKSDTLYFADGMNDTIVALAMVSTVRDGGIVARDEGMTFTGPDARRARVVLAGKPLDGPISTALLPNGNLIVGNTLDPDGKNLLIEVNVRNGRVLDVRNVDKGPAGALFGIAISGSSASDTKIYFNDDNDNNVQVLEM